MVRRYFHRYMNDKHFNKKWSKQMGGYIGLDSDKSEYIRGQSSTSNEEIKDAIEASYNSLNLAIDRLDKLIREMQDNLNATTK